MTLGDQVLDWLLRRLRQQKKIDTDLVLVVLHESIADTPPVFDMDGERWQFVRAKGELALRHALLGGQRLVAAIPSEMRVPLDLSGRAYMGRPILVEAHDIVAGLAGNHCVRIQDPTLRDSILKKPLALVGHGTAFSATGRAVTETEVKQVLVAVELGFDRKLERLSPEALLAKWMVAVPKIPSLPELATDVLKTAHGQVGEWLAWALREGKMDTLCVAGALAGTEKGRALAPPIPQVETDREWETLRKLVEDAAREAWKVSPSAVAERLAGAEAEAHRLRLDLVQSVRHPLLRSLMETALFECAEAAAEGKPPKQADIAALGKNLHHKTFAEAMHLVEELCRVARFCGEAEGYAPGPGGDVAAWAVFARDHTAWADLAARAARRWGEHATELKSARRRVLDRYLEVRDGFNRRFAEKLAQDEASVYRHNVQLPEALPLHLVTKTLIAPLVEDGCRVLLLVLDGCDLSSFYELLRNRGDLGIGLSVPPLSGRLKGQLESTNGMLVGLSPLPTVTSHSRRSIYAGDIPKNPILGDVESAAANARGDEEAFAKNAALRNISRRLLLKGELDADGEHAIRLLESANHNLVSIVLNGIDDALSSHETTAMGPWRFGDLGASLNEILRTAMREGWTIVVTSDHGHTPFWTTDRKVSAQGARYGNAPAHGAVTLEASGLRREALYVLTSVGGYGGTQRRGFHGGASLEEVVVPIAILGPAVGDESLPVQPAWWNGEPIDVLVVAPAPSPAGAESTLSAAPIVAAAGSVLRSDIVAAFHDQPRLLRLLDRMATKGLVTENQLSVLVGQKPLFIRGQVSEIQRTLQRRRMEIPFVVEKQGDEDAYRWKLRS